MRKEDIRKAFADLAIHKPLKLRPPSGPIASQDKKISTDVAASKDVIQSTDTFRSEDLVQSRDQKQTQDKVVSPDSLGSGDTHRPTDALASRVEIKSEDRNGSRVGFVSRDLLTSGDTKNARDTSQPQDRNTSKVTERSEDSVRTRDQKRSLDAHESRDDSASRDQEQSLDRDLPEYIERGSNNPRRATIQDQAVIQISSLKGKLTNGYTCVSNSLLMEMVKGDLSRSEMKILLLVARLTTSFNRDMAPISKAVLERETGIQGRKALVAVADLESKGLIRKRKGDQMRPNELGLTAKVTWGKKPSEDTSGPDPQDPKRSKGWDPNGPHFKDKKENKEKISLSKLPETLQNYLSELKPDAKRESEAASLERLKRDFSIEQIEIAFSHLSELEKAGEPKRHSPMAFLEKAIGDVLPVATAAREKLELRHRNEAEAERAAQDKLERDDAEAKEFERIEQAFHETFPTEQERKCAFERFAPAHQYFRVGSRPFEMQAINNWFQSKGGA